MLADTGSLRLGLSSSWHIWIISSLSICFSAARADKSSMYILKKIDKDCTFELYLGFASFCLWFSVIAKDFKHNEEGNYG